MDRLFYEAKHAHFATLRLWRPFTTEFGLTPARVDLLRVVQVQLQHRILQSALPELLNVSKTVVSIMVRALERRGFLDRVRSAVDGRTFVLTLTLKAKVALRALYHQAVHFGLLALALAHAITPSRTPQPDFARRKFRLERRLVRLRESFGRGCAHHNPWWGDEGDEDFFYDNVIGNPNNAETAAVADMPDENFSDDDEIGFLPLGKPRDEARDVVDMGVCGIAA